MAAPRAVAVDLDGALGDTSSLWRAWVEDVSRRARVDLAGEHDLDSALGNWRELLQRFAEEHAPVHLRPNPEANAALRRLRTAGARLSAFTEAPEPLARVAAAHLGVARLLDELEAGPGALDRLRERLPEPLVVRSLEELRRAAS